jgi:adenosylcobinamide-phosphate synthase
MSFFAVLVALLLEQVKPVGHQERAQRSLQAWVDWTGRNFDAGKRRHAWVVWSVAVLGPTLLVALSHLVLRDFSLPLALAFDVAVLYLTLGFREFSHHFSALRDALDRSDEPEARRVLAQWRGVDEVQRADFARAAIEHALLAAHRRVFGVLFWFVVFSAIGLGPAGAVLYRLSEFLSRDSERRHGALDTPVNDSLRQLVERLFGLIDHLPARLTAFGFAVVGDFEEAVDAWRRDAGQWLRPNDGVILAAAGGALGIPLGADAAPMAPVWQVGHLQSTAGLVWRSVVLWMLMLALLSLANLVG